MPSDVWVILSDISGRRPHCRLGSFCKIVILSMVTCLLPSCDILSPALTPVHERHLEEARLAMADCRKTICETKFWDNPHCGEAYYLAAVVPSKHSSQNEFTQSDEFIEELQGIRYHLNISYYTSLEHEVGYSILPNSNICDGRLGHRFKALDGLLSRSLATDLEGK